MTPTALARIALGRPDLPAELRSWVTRHPAPAAPPQPARPPMVFTGPDERAVVEAALDAAQSSQSAAFKFSGDVAAALAEADRRRSIETTNTIDAATALAVHARMTEPVIGGALVCVRQNFVGFLRFLEFFFRLLVIRILIWMVLYRHFAVRLLDFVLRCGFRNS